MRLLPKNDAARGIDDFRAALVQERNRISLEIAALTKKKNELSDLYASQRAAIDAEILGTAEAAEEKKKILAAEVAGLEERKKEALKPVEERLKRAEEAEKRAKEQQKTVISMAQKLGEERSALMDRLSEVTDRENLVKEKETSVEYRLTKVAEAEELNKRSTNALSGEWLNFRKTSEAKEQELSLREQELRSAQEALEKEKQWCFDEKGRLHEFERRVRSEREAVDAAFKELNKKSHVHVS